MTNLRNDRTGTARIEGFAKTGTKTIPECRSTKSTEVVQRLGHRNTSYYGSECEDETLLGKDCRHQRGTIETEMILFILLRPIF